MLIQIYGMKTSVIASDPAFAGERGNPMFNSREGGIASSPAESAGFSQ
jgi:hypothetical protein